MVLRTKERSEIRRGYCILVARITGSRIGRNVGGDCHAFGLSTVMTRSTRTHYRSRVNKCRAQESRVIGGIRQCVTRITGRSTSCWMIGNTLHTSGICAVVASRTDPSHADSRVQIGRIQEVGVITRIGFSVAIITSQ